jgi:hypothetical protein
VTAAARLLLRGILTHYLSGLPPPTHQVAFYLSPPRLARHTARISGLTAQLVMRSTNNSGWVPILCFPQKWSHRLFIVKPRIYAPSMDRGSRGEKHVPGGESGTRQSFISVSFRLKSDIRLPQSGPLPPCMSLTGGFAKDSWHHTKQEPTLPVNTQ